MEEYKKFNGRRLLNVYAPSGHNNLEHTRNFFGENLFKVFVGRHCIMGGDWNCVIERKDVEEGFNEKQSVVLEDLVKYFEFEDAFQIKSPEEEIYMFERPGLSQSWLDRVYVPKEIIVETIQTLSDHKSVLVEI